MEDVVAIARYEDYLMHKSQRFYLTGTDMEKEKSAISILRYIVSDLLGWTPYEAVHGLTPHVAKQMHIDMLLIYIDLPKDIIPDEDYDFLIHMAYPNEVPYNPEKKIIRNYEYVLRNIKPRFPKNYFHKQMGGYMRARCMLAYAIDKNIIIKEKTATSLYGLFANTEKINALLKEWKLKNVCKALYNNNALQYLHDTLEETAEGEFLYHYYSFMKLYNTEVKQAG